MKATKRAFLNYIALSSLIAVASGFSSGQASSPVTKELVWSRPESEIASPQFSADGNFIVLVSRIHWPDGEEAEGLPHTFFDKLEQRQRKNPRFADPVIKLIDLKGNVTCETRYGSHPSVSPDNKNIAFSRQKNPITGLRPLAETEAGNDIEVFDCEKKQARPIAQPEAGYLDNPIFLPDGESIAYTLNEAVNGAMGGAVGVERVALTGTAKTMLLAKESTPAVPCSPSAPPKSDLEAYMCSQPTKLSSAFHTLVLDVSMADGQLIVLHAKPVPSPGDMYLAKHYTMNLVSVFPQQTDMLSLEKRAMDELWKISVQFIANRRVLIFSPYWKAFSLETRSWLPDVGPQNPNHRSVYSPDLRYYIAGEPSEYPDHFTLYRTTDGQRLFTSPRLAAVYDMAWSRDSKKFAVVALPKGVSGSTYREDLFVYSVR